MVIGFIYKIYDNTNGSVYYGSTKNKISQRMAIHRQDYKRWVDGRNTGCCKSFDIIKNEDYAYSLVEEVEYENKMELLQRERWYIENNECVNKFIPARTRKESRKAYDETHKTKVAEYKKAYYDANKDTIKEYKQSYREANADAIKEQRGAFYDANKERLKEQTKAYREANKEKIRERDRERWANRSEEYREKERVRSRAIYAKKKAKINEPSV